MYERPDSATVELRAPAILTTSYVAGTVLGPQSSVRPANYRQLIVYVDFTKGSLTSAQLKIEFSHNGTDWFQETNAAVSGANSTLTNNEFTFTEDTNKRIAIPIADNWIRISVKGTGTVTSSEMGITAVLSN